MVFMKWEKSKKKHINTHTKTEKVMFEVNKCSFFMFFSPRWSMGAWYTACPTIMATAGTNSWPEKSDGKKISGRSSPSPIFLVKLDGQVLKIGYPPWNSHSRTRKWMAGILSRFVFGARSIFRGKFAVKLQGGYMSFWCKSCRDPCFF